ncbi:bifunctional ATPase [Babesia duncani]|uniref:V-type proton ATPase subunit a n=1 Tax=Babesia duncani TaxID=323732 RepID=A0AAD9PL27_9APIC|nr:bifunctional ATPase [Babesia duncani]
MGIFRSETMGRGTLVLPQDRARDIIDTLSRNTNIQFIDMNENKMNRPYKKYVQRIVAMERMIRMLYDEIAKLPNTRIEKNHIDSFLEYDSAYRLDQVEESLQKLYDQFVKFKENNDLLKNELEDALYEYYVMLVSQKQQRLHCSFNSEKNIQTSEKSVDLEQAPLVNTEQVNINPPSHNTSTSFFSNIAGLISMQNKDAFSRAVFRTMRGNVYTYFIQTTDLNEVLLSKELIDSSERNNEMAVFVIYCQFLNNSVAFEKLQKLCAGFQAKTYTWTRSIRETCSRLAALEEIIRDKRNALNAYHNYFRAEIACLLETLRPDGNSVIEEWCLFCKKEKYIYYILNHFKQTDITLQADIWFPVEEEEKIYRLLAKEKNASSVSALLLPNQHHDNVVPPTYNKTNAFTRTFQGVVDTYGIPTYKEINPAPFTCITFPFLFGIMFGDIGHGICLIFFALFLIFCHQKLANKYTGEVSLMVINGRYMILLMGIFATYTGFIYNDFLSIPNNLFSSRWVRASDTEIPAPNALGGYYETFVPAKSGFPIPFGLDPAWIHANNEQAMLHSFKMKFAVIVGFLQMAMGVCLKALNAIYFRYPLDFYFEFLPQIVMLISFVGYMDFLIFYKWLTPVDGNYAKPSIISTIIDMCMLKELGPDQIMYKGQQQVQLVLMILIVACVPLMLFPKPLLLYLKQRRKPTLDGAHLTSEHEMVYCADVEAPGSNGFKRVSSNELHDHFAVVVEKDEGEHHEEHGIADLFIHQLIETVEFSLGCISNTASYLRLWALSLSHQQLSLVFFKQCIFSVLDMEIGVAAMVFILFFTSIIFAIITFFVMLCMDSLECYLHALRLQWVEFQNKFFKAEGHPFKPFNIRKLLESNEDEIVVEE